MKRCFFKPAIVAALLLTSLGISRIAVAHLSQDNLMESTDKISLGDGEDVKFVDEENDPEEEESSIK